MTDTTNLRIKLAFCLYPVWAVVFGVSWLILAADAFSFQYIIPPLFLAALMTLSGVIQINAESGFKTVADVIKARKGIIIMFVFLYVAMLAIIYFLLLNIFGSDPRLVKIALWFTPLVTVYLWSAVSR